MLHLGLVTGHFHIYYALSGNRSQVFKKRSEVAILNGTLSRREILPMEEKGEPSRGEVLPTGQFGSPGRSMLITGK